jgi:hypothetical protein
MIVNLTIPGTTVNVDTSALSIYSIRDIPGEQRVAVKLHNIPLAFVVWDGSTEYAAASAWTNETVLAASTDLLTLSADSIKWLF